MNDVREMHYGIKALKGMKRGVAKIANAVGITLGPRGNNAIISQQFHAVPQVTKDGVTVAKKIIRLEDNLENAGNQMVRSAAEETNKEAGDGTTTATILVDELLEHGIRQLSAGGNAMSIRRGMEKAVKQIVKHLDTLAIPIEIGSEQVTSVSTLSANNDRALGKIISEAVNKVGKDGIITPEKSQTLETTIEYAKGIEFNQGMSTGYFTNTVGKYLAEYDNPYILIYKKGYNGTVTTDMQKWLVEVASKINNRNNSALLILAEDIQGELLTLLVENKLKNKLPSIVVKHPFYGDKRKNFIEDLATYTGATIIGETTKLTMDDVKLSHLGTAKKIVVDRYKTRIIDGKATSQAASVIEEKVEEKKAKLEETSNKIASMEEKKEDTKELKKEEAALQKEIEDTRELKKEEAALQKEIEKLNNKNKIFVTYRNQLARLKNDIKAATIPRLKENAEERLARITGKVAVIRVGGTNDTEVLERKDLVEDATHATQAALAEGIVPGGGTALLRAAAMYEPFETEDSDETVGANIVLNALKRPLRTIARNAGNESPDLVVEKVYEMKGNMGWNAYRMQYEDLLEAGIIDPKKVVRTALEKAAAVAGSMLSSGVVIIEKQEEIDFTGAPQGQRM